MLTARNEEPDIIVVLEMGADDYLVKPVSLRQLVARIRAVLARNPNRVYSRLQLMESAFGDYYEGFERTIDSHISRLRAAVERLDLRDLSLAEVGRLSRNLAALQLGDLIADLAECMEPAATEKGITLLATVAPDLPPVTADADRVRADYRPGEGSRFTVTLPLRRPQAETRPFSPALAGFSARARCMLLDILYIPKLIFVV